MVEPENGDADALARRFVDLWLRQAGLMAQMPGLAALLAENFAAPKRSAEQRLDRPDEAD